CCKLIEKVERLDQSPTGMTPLSAMRTR
ncbi:MAG: hypothetical protein AVDCRST_MAG56-7477, partial [uncultured Cytophagales bacterium]